MLQLCYVSVYMFTIGLRVSVNTWHIKYCVYCHGHLQVTLLGT